MRRRHEAVTTSISWIPSEFQPTSIALPKGWGVVPYDDPPPEQLSGEEGLAELRSSGLIRGANVLRAWVEVGDEGRIADLGYGRGGVVGSSRPQARGRSIGFESAPFSDLRTTPEIRGSTARFVQTSGGRLGAPLPRRVRTRPYVRLQAPTIWTTIALEIDADGTSRFELLDASPFPRHWLYGPDWIVSSKSGLIDATAWADEDARPRTPWGDEGSTALVTAVETSLERRLSSTIMRGSRKPRIIDLEPEALLTVQGTPGDELYVLLDGVLRVEVDGEAVAEVGPGAVLGERAILEGGLRRSTLRAVTRCKVAAAAADEVDREALVALSRGHGAPPELAV